MTKQDLKNSQAEVTAKYDELGGIESMLPEFMATLNEAIDFELNESDEPLELVSQFFNDRYQGVKQKITLADSLAKIAERNEKSGKKWNPVTRAWN